MHQVQVLLSLPSNNILSFSSDEKLYNHYGNNYKNDSNIMAVIFKNVSGNSVPKNLNYAIRPYDEDYTWTLTKLNSENFGYIPDIGSESFINSGFVALQMAIDSIYLELTLGSQPPVEFVVQEFPYPPYANDAGLSTLFIIILPLITVCGFICLCPVIIRGVVEEKKSGMKELMKMMGLKNWMLWAGWFFHAFIATFICTILITYSMTTKVWNSRFPVIEFCDTSLYFSFILLYSGAAIVFCLAISSLFNKPTTAMIIGILLWFVTYIVPSNIIQAAPAMLYYRKLLFCFLPNAALFLGYQAIATFESREIGSKWSNLFQLPTGGSEDVTLGCICMMFIVDICVYMLIALYFENVKPGPYGIAKPLNFPIMYFYNLLTNKRVGGFESEKNSEEYCKVESGNNLTPSITIKNLYKVFGENYALNGLTFDIYEGQITALLGHNGAGKTTAMSIITGMISPTNGKVLIYNNDIQTSMNEVKKFLGFCPQHNLQFADFTVLQHVIFFAMLKGLSYKDAIKESRNLIKRLNLTSKRHFLASALSGGMLRKLSLAISLIGNPKLLILDEPTSGLDPEARREIWDLLLSLRGSRTVLITTHLMEEADVLGDRIAIMDHGRLICYGTSMFLKKEYGTGYHLNVTVTNSKDLEKIVKEVIPSAVLQDNKGNHFTFLLPYETTSKFSTLLEKVEEKKDPLGISSMSMSVTTLEEVFLRVGNIASKERKKPQNQIEESTKKDAGSASVKLEGNRKLQKQLMCLFQKRIQVTTRKWKFYIMQLIMVILLTFLTLYSGDHANQSVETEDIFDINLKSYGKTTVFYGGAIDDSVLSKIIGEYNNIVESQLATSTLVPSVSEALIKEGIKNIEFYKQHMVVAAEFNNTKDGKKIINALHSSNARCGVPISLNLVFNSVLKGLKGNEYSITTTIQPLPTLRGGTFQKASVVEVQVLWLLLFPLGIMFLCGTFVLFPHMERVTNLKQMQLMCGVRPIFYWLICYICDLLLYTIVVVVILTVVVLYGCFYSNMFSGLNEIATLCALLFAFGCSAIPCAYLFSYKKTGPGGFSAFILTSLLLSFVFILVQVILETMNEDYYRRLAEFTAVLASLFPYFGLAGSAVKFSGKAVMNYNWKIQSPEQKTVQCQVDYNPCCEGYEKKQCINHQSYLFGKDGVGTNILTMLFSTFIYFSIILLLDTHFFRKICSKLVACIYNKIYPQTMKMDEVDGNYQDDVFKESQRVYNILKLEKSNDLLLVHNLHKMYFKRKVVKGVSFGVKAGDCFGLLGVNGAGKTTTFRMLTGDIPLLEGDVRIRSLNKGACITKETKKVAYLLFIYNLHLCVLQYLENVGYCPQFDIVNDVLTGREMIRLFAGLRGVSINLEGEVNMWLQALGLEEYADKVCSTYSGGNKRKLAMAVALIGDPLVIMLDEPTSGVDPVSRRKLWDVVKLIQQQDVKPSIIVTSHSMEECEALCNKLAIMKSGKVECYGTIPNLKIKYGQGFTVMLKLNSSQLTILTSDPTDDTAGGQDQSLTNYSFSNGNLNIRAMKDKSEVSKLMMKFENKFKNVCTLRDEHSGLLHYHINDTNMKWSTVFKEIEEMKGQHPIVEDYTISETTLEEVFLSIARLEL
ncbi:hypothetical protein FQA39_LY04689 [Lamprigera yunnana]|nr:hypothetical protein FQA39_LY04689 [Lamprigera yunnana]